MTILVVIVTYNAKDWLNTCIGELYNLDNIKIVVIDNNSTDETVVILKETYPLVHLIESNTNLGFGKANNLGFEFAIKNNFNYVFLLNQDASINQDSLLKLVANYNRYDDVGILSPIHYKNGFGLLHILNYSYEGEWKENKKCGLGTFKCSDGYSYEEKIVDDLKELILKVAR